ncbi:MAG: response regulator [SAR324 cluster bacterium]|nr:response regulator [SAR324 cluster bacterium]
MSEKIKSTLFSIFDDPSSTRSRGMQEKVLIVDDQENNRLVIEDILRKLKYEIKSAASGEEALTILKNWIPDLILMDQMMPGLSGIETTAKIKAQGTFNHIPIVMVTAKNEVDTLSAAFEAGAVDYIIKPVERITLTARARSAIRTKQAFDQIKALTEDLKAQKRELSKFTHMVSHDLKSPVASAASLFDFFLLRLEEDYPHVMKDLGLEELLLRIPEALTKMLKFIDTMLNYASAGKIIGETKPVFMNEVLKEVILNFDHLVQDGIVTIDQDPSMPKVSCDPIKMRQVWQNLINNAIKHRGEQNAVSIELGWKEENEAFHFWVQDDGPGIEPEDQKKIFEPFLRMSDVEGSGIGLATVHQIIIAHRGNIWVDPEYQRGARFIFRLPSQ